MSSHLQDSIFLITSTDPNNRRFGTGFTIHKDENSSYILTCAHVIADVNGSKQNRQPVRADDHIAQIIAMDDDRFPDLAVLKVEDLLDKPPLELSISGNTGSAFIIAGWSKWSGEQHVIKELRGELGKDVALTREGDERVKAWDLRIIDDDDVLEPGYSGSPVFHREVERVVGVVSDRHREGKRGLAISIEALETIWPEMPPGLIKQDLPAEYRGKDDRSVAQLTESARPLSPAIPLTDQPSRKIPVSTRTLLVVATVVIAIIVTLLGGLVFLPELPIGCGGELADVFSYIKRAQTHRDEGRYTCARRDFENGLKIAISNLERAQLYYGLSTVALAEENPTLAHELARQGLELDPTSESLLYLSDGLALCQLQRNAEAVQQLEEFLGKKDDHNFPLHDVEALYGDIAAGRDVANDCFWMALVLP